MSKEKSVVTVSRKWNNPKIHTVINADGISLSIDLDDFIAALIKEIGSVALTMTKAQFEKQIKKACENVIQGVKEESVKVV